MSNKSGLSEIDDVFNLLLARIYLNLFTIRIKKIAKNSTLI